MNFDIPAILQLAGAAIIGLLIVLYKYHEDRLKTLETTRQNKADADQQRTELRAEVQESREEVQDFRDDVSKRFEALSVESAAKRVEAHDQLNSFKTEISKKVETMRTETNTKLDQLVQQHTALFAQIAALAPKRKR